MRSAEPRRSTTLARHLAWTLVIVSALAASLATAAALLLADTLIRDHVEESVQAAANVLAVEIDEKPSYIDEGLDSEAREMGIDDRVAVIHAQEGVIAGDPSLVVPRERCGMISLGPGHEEFACQAALELDPELRVVVAIPAARIEDHRAPLLRAGFGVIVVVVFGAALVGLALARRMLRPLERLRRAVSDIDVRAPAAVELPVESKGSSFAELDSLRGAIANLLGRLDEELERTRRFSSAAAHELRTPLTKMHAELELVLEGEQDPASARATFERLFRTTDHLVALSERLLLLATPRESLQSHRGSSIAALAEALIERRTPEDAARLTIVTSENDGLVRGDELLLAAMLDNVVDNALKFSTGSVRVEVDERADDVVIRVDDEGPGVSDELAAELFEPFRRTTAARAQPGHGLGLALVAHVAAAYGGSVEFVRGRERGARIEITLPLAR